MGTRIATSSQTEISLKKNKLGPILAETVWQCNSIHPVDDAQALRTLLESTWAAGERT